MRRKDREVTDIADIRAIIEDAKVMRLGLNDGKRPYIVPLHYAYEYDEKENTYVFYAHSATEGHKLDLITRDGNAFVEIDNGMSLISGGDIACRYGARFASFMGSGCAEIIQDPARKIHALRLLMKQQTGRDFDIDETAVSSVTVIAIRITDHSAKAHR